MDSAESATVQKPREPPKSSRTTKVVANHKSRRDLANHTLQFVCGSNVVATLARRIKGHQGKAPRQGSTANREERRPEKVGIGTPINPSGVHQHPHLRIPALSSSDTPWDAWTVPVPRPPARREKATQSLGCVAPPAPCGAPILSAVRAAPLYKACEFRDLGGAVQPRPELWCAARVVCRPQCSSRGDATTRRAMSGR
jgi:hypothetical protein